MNNTFAILFLLFLVLLQTTLIPLNFAFAAVVFYDLFIEKITNLVGLLTVSVLVSLFGNFNIGAGLVAFTVAFLIILTLGKILPSNKLTKALLVVLSLPLAELNLVLFGKLFL